MCTGQKESCRMYRCRKVTRDIFCAFPWGQKAACVRSACRIAPSLEAGQPGFLFLSSKFRRQWIVLTCIIHISLAVKNWNLYELYRWYLQDIWINSINIAKKPNFYWHFALQALYCMYCQFVNNCQTYASARICSCIMSAHHTQTHTVWIHSRNDEAEKRNVFLPFFIHGNFIVVLC